MAKNLPVKQETQCSIRSISGLRRSPGEGNGNHPSILAWEILWAEEPGGGATVYRVAKELDTT